jgi:hypothetical protein
VEIEHYDLVRAGVISTGFSNPLQIGRIAVPGWNSFESTVRDGAIVRYRIIDPGDSDSKPHQQEVGYGVYSLAANSIVRNVTASTNGGKMINVSPAAHVMVAPAAEDFVKR